MINLNIIPFGIHAMQKYLDDQYLLLIVAVIVTPVLVVLIVQVAAFPKKLQQYEIMNKVK